MRKMFKSVLKSNLTLKSLLRKYYKTVNVLTFQNTCHIIFIGMRHAIALSKFKMN